MFGRKGEWGHLSILESRIISIRCNHKVYQQESRHQTLHVIPFEIMSILSSNIPYYAPTLLSRLNSQLQPNCRSSRSLFFFFFPNVVEDTAYTETEGSSWDAGETTSEYTNCEREDDGNTSQLNDCTKTVETVMKQYKIFPLIRP
ncbi:hypothetical protein BLNAU_8365 [Blattamonas nauphoetae]|uniref:Uncharacterized protein n=1 Tax=Blattamonas nauphoetae TaxID=2049346 RepID=A0ABQ9XZ17_9EUKA|nr:hypothetical protein BLNAU_8365 [Blattamonas nauphoetae]